MNLVPMRFKGVEWRHNPREISFECSKRVNELHAPYGKSYIQNTGRKCMLIKGEGELYGADCTEQFAALFELFKSGGSGVLAIPKLGALHAEFESLKIKGYPKPDVLTYSFVFREVAQRAVDDKPASYTPFAGETLWDVSYRFDMVIDRLIALNPWVKRPDENLDGKVVALC